MHLKKYILIIIGNVEYLAIELDMSIRAALKTAATYDDKSEKTEIDNATIESQGLINLPLKIDQSKAKSVSSDMKLSRRQRELLPLLDVGLTNHEIAMQLGVSEHTVKVHMWRFFKKTNAHNRTQLLYLARMNGWI